MVIFRTGTKPVSIMMLSILCYYSLIIINNAQSTDDFFYNGFNDAVAAAAQNITLNGAASIEKRGLLRLTNGTSRLLGHAFHSTPLQFKTSANASALSFSTNFVFSIVPEYAELGGHGMAFVISPTPELQGAYPRQYLGLFNTSNMGNSSNRVFAVEFDTVQDLEFKDIDDNHVGVDINSLESIASATCTYFATNMSKQVIGLQSGNKVQAWIDYDSIDNVLNVTVSLNSVKPTSALISIKVDLSQVLLENMFVGFSASTGRLASAHYVLGWSFRFNGVSRNLDISSLPSLPLVLPNKHNALKIGVSVTASMVIIITILLSIYLIRKLKYEDVIEEWELNIGPHRFDYQELKRATRGFKEKELLGFGGFGKVYKGTLPTSKVQVAVKRISHESKQGLREFVSEISSIGRLRHRNLVQLLGWCRRRGDLLLVYDFMPNGSLDQFIFDSSKLVLNWEKRFRVLKGVASGLLYLHEEWEQVVVHRDVKASNVLLDADLSGRLGDFGLARLYEHGSNPSTTRVVGTLGYLAPELTRTGKATTSTDVYAFGALLLEVVCGRRPIENKASPEELVLVDWVWERWREGRILEAVDGRLEGEYDEGEVVMVLKLGLMCSNGAAEMRPSMRQVVGYLEGEAVVPVVVSAPGEGEGWRNEFGFDDFVHSYLSSSEKAVSLFSFQGGGNGDATRTTNS
ncbi:hypothetical protein Scep_005426 [Stephania cephalantha]|uniref:non-specific serine/threonine protein kinase n=1 Tax=Stephania cephalantha TaxID=152367 RepID=A0AAP0KW04_9MAGN